MTPSRWAIVLGLAGCALGVAAATVERFDLTGAGIGRQDIPDGLWHGIEFIAVAVGAIGVGVWVARDRRLRPAALTALLIAVVGTAAGPVLVYRAKPRAAEAFLTAFDAASGRRVWTD